MVLKTDRVHLFLAQDEKAIWKILAAIHNMSLAEFIRTVVTKYAREYGMMDVHDEIDRLDLKERLRALDIKERSKLQ